MFTTITLWTLIMWAEPRRSDQALASTQVPGFATREACLTAREILVLSNTRLLQEGSARVGGSGIDIKMIVCIPVEMRQNNG